MGYKIARVDQLETSIGMEKRKKEQNLKGVIIVNLVFDSHRKMQN